MKVNDQREGSQNVASNEDGNRELILHVDEFESGVPDGIIELIDELPFIKGGEDPQELALIEEGRCVCCHRACGTDTTLVINNEGIQALLCSGPCHGDLLVMGYLYEQTHDVLQSVAIRSQMTPGGND